MNNESIPQQRRSRGRPKKNVNYATLAGFTNLNRPAPANLNRSAPANLNRPAPTNLNRPAPTNLNRPAPANFNRPAPANLSRPAPANFNQPAPANFNRPTPASLNQPAPVNLNHPANLNRPSNVPIKRKQVEEEPDEIQILSTNGLENVNSQIKKIKLGEDPAKRLVDDQPKRSLPHRAARFTESYGGSPDVVVVSDEENEEESESESDSDCSPIPSPVCKLKTKEELEFWESNVQRLKKQLNDEEMKLVLLLKLKESQKSKEPKTEASGSPLPSSTLATNLTNFNSQKSYPLLSRNNVQQSVPNKQLMPSKFLPVKKEIKPNTVVVTSNGPQRHSSPAPVTIVKTDPSSNSTTVSQSSQLKSNTLNQYPLLKSLSNQITVTPVPSAPSPVASQPPEEKIDPETIYQRQAAAKLALRKQLEKQLLQIPLPKAPPMKLNFFPNANSIEFLCLLGLDCVVDFLTKTKRNPPREKPLCCAQCSTDFTCSWKWKEIDKNGEKVYNAFCEACINSNIRKNLKAQHTNSLKAAFLKALQQEKEIDRLSQTLSSKSHSSTREPQPRQNSRLPVPAPAHQAPAHQAHNSSAFSLSKAGTTITYIPKPTSSVNHAGLGQVGKLNPQFQSLLQAQAQHLLASGVPLHPNVLSLTSFMPPSTHHNQGKSTTGQHDFRRQYRPDRTQSPSIPPASSSWKS